MSDAPNEVVREVTIPNEHGFHLRPVAQFADVAKRYRSAVTVRKVNNDSDAVDGKSAMHLVLLEAAKGCILRIEARGDDALEAVNALTALVKSGFPLATTESTDDGAGDDSVDQTA